MKNRLNSKTLKKSISIVASFAIILIIVFGLVKTKFNKYVVINEIQSNNTSSFAENESSKSSFNILNSKFANLNKISGVDKYETATLICRTGWQKTASNIVLVAGEDYSGALCSAPLAAKLKAPILLTNKNELNNFTKEEVLRLKPKKIYIIGGQDVVAKNIDNQIEAMNVNVIRIGGRDKYETSFLIARALGKQKKIFVVHGDNYPDALSVAPVASKERAPIIFMNNGMNLGDFRKYLHDNSISQSYLIGSSKSLSDDIYKELPNCTRIYGNNKYETNSEIINKFSDELNLKKIYICSGDNFFDAVSCAPLAGLNSSPIVFMSSNTSEPNNKLYKSISSFLESVNIVGRDAVIPIKNISDYSTAANAENYLDIPTYEGSKQACHPKVIYFQDGWNGWKYWMVMTPYPDSQDCRENPSIVVSNSGNSWTVPKNLTNPITPLPQNPGQHSSDPTLVYNKENNILELWYRFTSYDMKDEILKMTSSNGISWSKPKVMLNFYGEQKCLSPAITLEDNEYKMWYINEKHKCMYITSTDGSTWSTPLEVNLNLGNSYVPWHIDIVHTCLGYEAVFCGFKENEMYSNNRILFWNISKDGNNFENVSKVILRPSSGNQAWDNKQIYKSTFVKVDGVYKLYYCAMDKNYRWHIGLTQGYDFDNLHGYEGNTKK